ncbi:MAG TPA: hypothetical protein VFX70_16190 [Mycobacteriales bacterium]|nr:hypothetical protein [Mycobacteriales bacterium]
MPEVDFMVVCDYVRADAGGMHMIAAGVDRIQPSSVPYVQNLGVATRLALTRAECDVPHHIRLIFQDQDGKRILDVTATIAPKYPDDLPVGWRVKAGVALNVGVPLPDYGLYAFELLVDGQSRKSIEMVVAPPPPPDPQA